MLVSVNTIWTVKELAFDESLVIKQMRKKGTKLHQQITTVEQRTNDQGNAHIRQR